MIVPGTTPQKHARMAAAYRFASAALGPCDLPDEIELPPPPATNHWRLPDTANSRTMCGRCSLALDVPAWDIRRQLRKHKIFNANASTAACAAAATQSAANFGLKPLVAKRSEAAKRGSIYRRWANGLGPAPFVVSRVRPPPPAEPLPQPGHCPGVRQAHLFYCPVTELRGARVDGIALTAASFGRRANGARRHLSALLADYRPYDGNIYHGLRMARHAASVWCVWQALTDLRASGISSIELVLTPSHEDATNALPPWEHDLLSTLVPLHKQNRSTFHRVFKVGSPLGQPAVGPASRYFEIDRRVDPLLIRMPRYVQRRLNLPPLPYHEQTVLLLLRTHSRRLVGSSSGTVGEVMQALCSAQLGHRLEVQSFDRMPLRQQIGYASNAALMIGVHGAQLTHAMWLREGSALLEILVRYGWCCEGQHTFKGATKNSKHAAQPPDPRAMCGACTGYAKPDYANIAHTFGARYAYLDAAFAEPARSHNLIDREAVHVDAADLARASLKLLRRAA